VTRLPDGREVDPANGCDWCGLATCERAAMARENVGPWPSDEWSARLAAAVFACESRGRVDWRVVARTLATQSGCALPDPPCDDCGAGPDERCAQGCPVAGSGDDSDAGEESLRQDDRGL